MKPLRLTIEGINSFVAERAVDFEQLSQNGIFCICGPTGSGKTTILDSIILALYAPPSHHRGTLKDYVNTKCDRGRISLEFSADGGRYLVTREFRKGKSTFTHKAELKNLDTGEILADKADTVTEGIKKMLKLDKDDFTKVVVLEQGRFAEFMQMTKSERCRTVSKLFGLERFEKLKETVAAAKNKYDRLIEQNTASLSEYEGITEEAHSDRKRSVAELNKQMTALKERSAQAENAVKAFEETRKAHERRLNAQNTLVNLAAQKAETDAAAKAAQIEEKAVEQAKAALDSLKYESDNAHAVLIKAEECKRDNEALAELAAMREQLLAKHKAADGSAKTLSVRIEELNAAIESNLSEAASSMRDVTEAGYTLDEPTEAKFAAVYSAAVADIKRLSEAEKKRAESAKKSEELQAKAEIYFTAQNRLNKEIAELERLGKEALNAYESARLANAAATVRGALHDGDGCPVCGGKYHGGEFADCADDRKIAALKEQAERYAAELKKLTDTLVQNREQYSGVQSALSAQKSALAEYQKILEGASVEMSQKAATAAQKGSSAAKKADDSGRQLTDLRAQLSAAELERDSIVKEGKRVACETEKLKTRMAERLGGKSVAEAENAANVAIRNYEKQKADCDARSQKLLSTKTELAARAASIKARCDAANAELDGLAADTFDEEAYNAATATLASLRAEAEAMGIRLGSETAAAEEIKRRLEKKKELARVRKEYMAVADNVAKLNKCVERDNKLLSFVAEEYVQSFTAAASDTLSSLTDGKYTLWYDGGDFYVADFFAGNARRKVKTLSGGETFLASMSIAMAISGRIASQNYEFFFLDEGFGTLHERALETVVNALYNLSRETTVGIVTHRGELSERIAARLTVTPATEDEGSDLQFALL